MAISERCSMMRQNLWQQHTKAFWGQSNSFTDIPNLMFQFLGKLSSTACLLRAFLKIGVRRREPARDGPALLVIAMTTHFSPRPRRMSCHTSGCRLSLFSAPYRSILLLAHFYHGSFIEESYMCISFRNSTLPHFQMPECSET